MFTAGQMWGGEDIHSLDYTVFMLQGVDQAGQLTTVRWVQPNGKLADGGPALVFDTLREMVSRLDNETGNVVQTGTLADGG